MISYVEALRQLDELTLWVEQADETGDAQRAVDARRALLAHPCAHHEVDEDEVLAEIDRLAYGASPADTSRHVPDGPVVVELCHRENSREIEVRTKQIARHLVGHELSIAPLTVADLEIAAEAEDEDPGSAKARAAHGARVLERGGALAWPPARNEPCWCGSGRKYKQCCGTVPTAAQPEAV